MKMLFIDAGKFKEYFAILSAKFLICVQLCYFQKRNPYSTVFNKVK